MRSDCDTLDDALAEFAKLKSYKPFKYGGTWFVIKASKEMKCSWVAYRTKRAALRNYTGGEAYEVKL